MVRLAHWCVVHRRTVLALWLLGLVTAVLASQIAGSDYRSTFSLPNTGSQRALDALRSDFPSVAGESDTIVYHVTSGSLRDPAARAEIGIIVGDISHRPHVTAVSDPFGGVGAPQVSGDGRTAFSTLIFDQRADSLPLQSVRDVITATQSHRGGGLDVELSGVAIGSARASGTDASALVGVVAAAIVLGVAFGSVPAMLIPLINAMIALGVATSFISLLSHPIPIVSLAPTLAILIGLGVGVDYALFIVTRHRAGLMRGRSIEESVTVALNTSGRAVLFAGLTVCIALLGLLLLGVSFLNGLAVGAAVGVATTMLGAVTLVPALLGFFGTRVLSRSQRRRLAAGPSTDDASRGWLRWAHMVERRPVLLTLLAATAMLLLTVPVLSMRLGQGDQGSDPASATTRRAYDLLAQGFGPGFNGPLLLVGQLRASGDLTRMATLATDLAKQPGVATVSPPVPSANGHSAIMQLYPTSSPQDAATTDLVTRLRSTAIPAAARGSTLSIDIGGATATGIDFSDTLAAKLPLFIGVVVALAFLLLMMAFRSLLIPVVASVMNLLAVGASFGVVVLIFQEGVGGTLIGIGREGPIDAFMPVILFAILFGLSMDYQVFLVSRMHEEWSRSGSTRTAVTIGQADTGGVITTASVIMVLVFLSFVFGGERIIKLFGVGLASAVLLDALVIRTVLVPALMHLLGRSNWWIPRWLDRSLPHLSIEGPTKPEQEVQNAV